MARIRLRPKYTDEELKAVYYKTHNSNNWIDHRLRVPASFTMVNWAIQEYKQASTTFADLSCGDGSIALGLAGRTLEAHALNSFVGDYHLDEDLERELRDYGIETLTGTIEENLQKIDRVGMFILSETLEHLDDPDTVLKQIREKSDLLFLSTPNGEKTPDNPEHYWGWELEDIRSMLHSYGWNPVAYSILAFPNLTDGYQMWVCR